VERPDHLVACAAWRRCARSPPWPWRPGGGARRLRRREGRGQRRRRRGLRGPANAAPGAAFRTDDRSSQVDTAGQRRREGERPQGRSTPAPDGGGPGLDGRGGRSAAGSAGCASPPRRAAHVIAITSGSTSARPAARGVAARQGEPARLMSPVIAGHGEDALQHQRVREVHPERRVGRPPDRPGQPGRPQAVRPPHAQREHARDPRPGSRP